jgi:uncharacterized protein
VKLFDANILLYAVDFASTHHKQAKHLLEEALSNELVAFSWEAITAFLRIITNPRIYQTPLTAHEAASYVEEWLLRPNSVLITASADHWQIFSKILQGEDIRANLIMDAHLAALAICHGAELYSSDTDFARFAGLKWKLVRQS